MAIPAVAAEPVPADAGGLTLDESIQIALHQNGDTRAASRSFESARQDVKAAKSDAYPQVTGSAIYEYVNQTGSTVTTVPGGTTSNGSTFTSRGGTTTTDVSVSQNLFDSGRIKTKVRQAEAGAVNAAGGFGTARNTLAYEVAQRFYEQLRQARLVTQRESQVALAQNQLDQVQAKFAAGDVARSDIQSVLVTVSQAKLDLSTARNDLRVAQTNFRNSLGLGRGPALTLKDEFPALTVPVAANFNELANGPAPDATETTQPAPAAKLTALRPIDSYVDAAQRLRPDLVQARANVQSAEAQVKLSKIDAQPQVTASAGYSIDPRDSGTRGFTFSAGLSVPIFDAGGLKATVRSSQADLDASRITLDQTQKDVAADVEAAYVDVQGQQDRLANASALVEQAQVNLDNATAKYRAGAGIILDIVNAQTQLFSAQNSYTGALYDSQLSLLNLDRATGRFAWADPNEAPPAAAPADVNSAAASVARLTAAKAIP